MRLFGQSKRCSAQTEHLVTDAPVFLHHSSVAAYLDCQFQSISTELILGELNHDNYARCSESGGL